MKIWMIHHYAIPPFVPGITRHFSLMKELAGHGHDATIIAADRNHRNPETCKLKNDEKYRLEDHENVSFLWLRGASSSKGKVARIWNMIIFSWRVLFGLGGKKLEKPDLVIGCTPDLFTALAAYWVAKKQKVKFILHLGDLWPLTLVEVGGISRFHPLIVLFGVIERYLYKRADLIVSPLPNAAEYIYAHGAAPGRVFYLENGVDLEKVPDVTVLAEEKTEPFQISYAGSYSKASGADLLLEVVSELANDNNIQFNFIGVEEENISFRQQVAAYDNVTVLPPRSKSDVYEVLAEANAFILAVHDFPLYQYGIAHNKIYDYLAMQRPIIISTSAYNNPIEEAGAGYSVPAGDIDAMVQAVRKLASQPVSALNEMGHKGRAYLEKGHTMKEVGRKLEQKLQEVLRT